MENKEIVKSAEENAGEMLRVPMNELPDVSVEFLNFISKKIGICLETCFTAYVYYSVFVLNMKCIDDSYIHSEWMNEWWNTRGYNLNNKNKQI